MFHGIPWNKGKPWSKEIRDKISASLKGRIPWNKGKHTRLIPWNKGKTNCFSEQTRQKLRENNARYWLGKKLSAKHRKNMSLAKKGLPSPLKGRKRPFTSKEHRKNLSIAIKRWWQRRKNRKKHDS